MGLPVRGAQGVARCPPMGVMLAAVRAPHPQRRVSPFHAGTVRHGPPIGENQGAAE